MVWKLGFLFIEHFEIFEQFRNCGLGGEVLKLLSKKYGCIVLESEPDVIGKEAKSRMEFYKKNGFCIIHKNYIQPPYDSSKPSVNLFLLSNYFIINLLEIENTIKKNVYL